MAEEKEIPRALIYVGLVIAAFNMVMVWVFIAASMLSARSHEAALNEISEEIYRAHLFGSEIEVPKVLVDSFLRSSAWDSQWQLIIVAFSFSLIGIGFALLVMGIRGTLSISTDQAPGKLLMLSASSPGLICLLLAMIPLCLYIYLQDKPIDPVAEGQAEVLRAKAELIEAQARAESEIKFAELQIIEAEAERARIQTEYELDLMRARADAKYDQ